MAKTENPVLSLSLLRNKTDTLATQVMPYCKKMALKSPIGNKYVNMMLKTNSKGRCLVPLIKFEKTKAKVD